MLVGPDPVCYHPLDVTAGEFCIDLVRVQSAELVAWGKVWLYGEMTQLFQKVGLEVAC